MEEPVLAVDIGSGTQDILVYLPGRNLENCPKLVMPSRTQIVGAQIRKVTALNQDLFLTGNLMGGGASTAAVKAHVRKGLKAYATKDAAKTFHDDLNVVKKMGIELVEKQPEGTERIVLADLDLAALQQALTAFDLELPSKVIAALQDHGECLEGSNREFRFKKWQEFILNGGELSDLVYREAPGYLTRMCALQKAIPHAYVMDTGAAAVWGALCDPVAGAWRERGLLVVNIGNSHTLGVSIKGSRILARTKRQTQIRRDIPDEEKPR
ncbi:MAG TPA: DUF1786 family protein, partial [Desulfobacteria bacterium]|nr:DUF1786 family protein [Desulfobacteria bacterium]